MAQVCRLIVHSFRKELQQKIQTDNHSPRQILDGIDKENDAVLEDSSTEINIKKIYNYILNNDANSLDLFTEIPGTVMEQKESFDHVTDENHHSFKKLYFVWPENFR